MTKREKRKTLKNVLKKVLLETWANEKARGVSLSAFCKSHGLSRNNFYLWLNNGKTIKQISAIHRVDPKLKAKAVEIHLRYKGTWCAETISMVFKGL